MVRIDDLASKGYSKEVAQDKNKMELNNRYFNLWRSKFLSASDN